MTKEEFKMQFADMFIKYVKVELEKGITFDTSILSDKIWELLKEDKNG